MTQSRGSQGGTLHYFSTSRREAAGKTPPRRASRERQPTVLVVDDQHVVLELVDAFLEDSGYRVFLAGRGEQALKICERLEGGIDLLLTDVRMPGMNGPELYFRIVERHPGVKVLFMSGFSAMEAARFGVPRNAPLIVKPFRPDELQHRLRLVIAGVLEFSAAGL